MINETPAPEDIRDAVERVTVSDVFARSPQLGAFLRFVVEAVLRGKADRIKAYTIGVEVLRRDVKFDPQLDPIVRVEATRLRRTIERYYTGPGADDPLIIDLPRGSYVPTFRWRESGTPPVAEAEASPSRVDWRGLMRSRTGIAALAAAAVLVLLSISGAVFMARDPVQPTDNTFATRESMRPVTASMLQPGNGMPSIYIEPLRVTGAPATQALSVDTLAEKIGDAFARFDTINVVYAPRTASADAPTAEPRSDYRLAGAVEYGSDTTAVQFRLIDVAEGNVVWSRSFDRIAPADHGVAEEQVVFALADTLLQSYGVIRSRDRAKQLVSNAGDPRYRCVLEAADSIRTLNAAEHDRALACLEHLTSIDPSFAVGNSFLAILYGRQFGMSASRSDGEPVLDRALRAVRRSIELNPASARAWTVLMVVLFHRQEVPEAFAAGEKALALNRYDTLPPAEYGGRLILVGETERGLAMMRRAVGANPVRPSWQHFYLFMGTYLSGDMKEAAYQAGQITESNYALGHLARALVASATGDAERARQAIERLVALQPGWRTGPRLELAKLTPNPLIVDRLAKDLTKAGLPGS